MRSKVYMADEIVNAQRKLGAALSYIAVEVTAIDGTKHIALFTPAEIEHGKARGEANPEDRERVEAILELRAQRVERERAAARTRKWAWGGLVALFASSLVMVAAGVFSW